MVQCPIGDPAVDIAQALGYLKLYQHNKIPNDRNVLLDLIFSNVRELDVIRASDPLLDPSLHHIGYECLLHHVGESGSSSLAYEEFFYDFSNGDYFELNNFLASIDWNDCLRGKDINIATNMLYDILSTGIAYFVPLKKFRTSTFPKWFSPELKRLTMEKKIVHSLYIESMSDCHYTRFSTLRAQCKTLAVICFNQYLRGIDLGLQNNPKSFWKYISDKRSCHSLPNSMFYKQDSATSAQEIADLFKEFFSTVYNNSSGTQLVVPTNDTDNTSACINLCRVTMTEIFEGIISLPNKLTTGPDGIPNILLKKCICTIVIPLSMLFNLSIETCSFPDAWKESFIVPIFKSGQRENIENYRSICIQSAIPKLFDSLVAKQLSWLCNGLISESQHGFCKNKSTETNLVCYQSGLIPHLENRKQVDAIYTDFSKAFDRVDHQILLNKLTALGFHFRFVEWLKNFSSGRSQRVRVGGHLSDVISVGSGVAQGGHTSPILFNIFVNDITKCFAYSSCLLFADDLKFWRVVETREDQELLQADLDRLAEWCNLNKLYLNVKKCGFISFTRKVRRIDTTYIIENTPLKYVSSVRDLGVILDEKLSFIEHINTISIKASKLLGFVTRNCTKFSVNATRLVYCSLVRSILEYCSVVWSPYYCGHIDTLERIQHRFLRHCAFRLHCVIVDHNYGPLEQQLALPQLRKRRDISGAIFVYRIIHYLINCPDLLCRIQFNIPRHGLRHQATFNIPFHRTSYGVCNPLDRYMGILNDCGTVDIFNVRLGQLRRSLALQ